MTPPSGDPAVPSARPDPSSTFLRWLGWIATATAMTMFFSYIDQIRLNLDGQKGSLLMPLATVVNCSLWATYGTLRRDWPVAAGNFPGVILGLITFLTAL